EEDSAKADEAERLRNKAAAERAREVDVLRKSNDGGVASGRFRKSGEEVRCKDHRVIASWQLFESSDGRPRRYITSTPGSRVSERITYDYSPDGILRYIEDQAIWHEKRLASPDGDISRRWYVETGDTYVWKGSA